MLAIVDYGLGNLGSLVNMFRRLAVQTKVTGDPEVIRHADKLLLPGVGAFDNGMKHIHERGLFDVLNEKVLEDKTPVLGICLGSQLLLEGSDEGDLPGLGWIEGTVRSFDSSDEMQNLKIPHMGWNEVSPIHYSGLFQQLQEEASFYFVHSYHIQCHSPDNVLATCHYGMDFTCAVQKDNIYGTQFHPEKSHKFGMQLLSNFAAI